MATILHMTFPKSISERKLLYILIKILMWFNCPHDVKSVWVMASYRADEKSLEEPKENLVICCLHCQAAMC